VRCRMHTEETPVAPVSPSPLVRCIFSVLVAGHLFGIFVAVTSYSSPTFPAPQLSVRASEPLQPYLQATFLNNAYRFFAPNPGTPAVFWFRVQYDDGSVRWDELPGHADSIVRAPYQRRLNLSVQLAQYLAPTSAGQGKQKLSPLGELLLQSCVRHVAKSASRQDSAGHALGVRNVGAYCVLHRVILPHEARAGWEQTDLRTYQPLFVGAYSPAGERIDEFKPVAVEHPIAHVVAGIIEVDVMPRLRERPGADPAEVVSELSLPEPVQRLAARHPELLAATPGDDLKRHIEAIAPGQPEGGR
jgi:hypothetical protein